MNFTGRPQIEPNAGMREAAKGFAAIFNPFIEVGFERPEALDLLKYVLSNGEEQK